MSAEARHTGRPTVQMPTDEPPTSIEQLLDSPDLAAALGNERFKQFLDQVPIAVAVSELNPVERVIYANLEFERLSGQLNTTVLGHGWQSLPGEAAPPQSPRSMGEAIAKGRDYLGSFNMPHSDVGMMVDAWSNIIEDDEGKPAFRLVALIAAAKRDPSMLTTLEEQVREKDTQLLELQHRVKNNLQMITALIRVEARGVTDLSTGEGFDRLAGRVEALGLLYRALGDSAGEGVVDLGIYLSEIASAVMRAHAVEGIHLDMQVDTWLVSLDVAMPTGLVVNELLTNTLKHAFQGRDGGTITLHSTSETGGGCRVLVADDGVGLPEGYVWPKQGKLSALIVRSLLQNARAHMNVTSSPGKGMQVEITFDWADAA
ncbi:MAG: histidine kinase dimerization/phosphoacceptor domain -containing protein [Phenylobacterium sp.]|uniref:sensor histidine kinase n=1 Tax=Phenylobacterium sp. TaxID=1871053 RepID=UPI0027230A16|nr:histidine kinase dimerization/phosphoacceptor domain -containing protein [Phenylobacterium sp.]MDO8912707.1 histidine kinase dimerization/phosphoacceptor domain -containing protein [Phenylobacterium sp.]HQT52707.1 histidine kinase dimerization/phosphoacceptor domain -containing protein [Phenylobacterium sp.]